MILWTALLLGLVGSLHCAGMCGPLMLAMPATFNPQARLLVSRLSYNAGRIATYTFMGGLFGLIGQTVALAGLQRWLSIGAGVVILGGLITSSHRIFGGPLQRLVTGLKRQIGGLLARRDLASQFGLGLLNGLLPCGLVYAGCAGATATSSFFGGLLYMLVFGLGTFPMMFALGLLGQRLRLQMRFKLVRLVPVSLLIVGALLIVRGMSLGIPYLSPDLSAPASCDRCH